MRSPGWGVRNSPQDVGKGVHNALHVVICQLSDGGKLKVALVTRDPVEAEEAAGLHELGEVAVGQ